LFGHGVIEWQHNHARLCEKWNEAEPTARHRKSYEARIDSPVVNHLYLVVPRRTHDIDPQPREALLHESNDWRNDQPRHETDGEVRSFAGGYSSSALERGGGAQQGRRFIPHHQPGLRQFGSALRALKKDDPKLVLERTDLPAEHGLGDMQRLRSSPIVELVRNSNEIAKLSEVEVGHTGIVGTGSAQKAVHLFTVNRPAKSTPRFGLASFDNVEMSVLLVKVRH
jgi:hypothetical protein